MNSGTIINLTNVGERERTVHLVDIENLVGRDADDVRALEPEDALDAYLDAARWTEGDLVYVAANKRLAFDIGLRTRVGCVIRAVGSAKDAADHALLELAPLDVVARAGRLVVGSGDHVFLERALGARERGVGVVVVARPEAVHTGWRRHGFPVVPLRPVGGKPTTPAVALAA